jgi:hypothetical protein
MLTFLDTICLMKAMSKKNRENISKKKTIFYGSRGGYRVIKAKLVSI